MKERDGSINIYADKKSTQVDLSLDVNKLNKLKEEFFKTFEFEETLEVQTEDYIIKFDKSPLGLVTIDKKEFIVLDVEFANELSTSEPVSDSPEEPSGDNEEEGVGDVSSDSKITFLEEQPTIHSLDIGDTPNDFDI